MNDDNNNFSQQPFQTGPNNPKGNSKLLISIIIGVTVVLAAAVGGFLYLNDSDDSASTSTPTSQNSAEEANASTAIEVEITADGFLPEAVLIDQGDTIRWVNNDTEPHYIASNPYPERTELPSLDSKQPIGPGATYEYTFDSVGDFGYHDDLNPLMNGTVTVQQPTNE